MLATISGSSGTATLTLLGLLSQQDGEPRITGLSVGEIAPTETSDPLPRLRAVRKTDTLYSPRIVFLNAGQAVPTGAPAPVALAAAQAGWCDSDIVSLQRGMRGGEDYGSEKEREVFKAGGGAAGAS